MGYILNFLCTNTVSSDVFYSHIFYLCSSFERGNALIFLFPIVCLSCPLLKLNNFRVVVSLDESSVQPSTGSNNCFSIGKGRFRLNASFNVSPYCVDLWKIPLMALIDFCRILSLLQNLSTVLNIFNTFSSFSSPSTGVSLRESSVLSTTFGGWIAHYLTLSQTSACRRCLPRVIGITFKPDLFKSL